MSYEGPERRTAASCPLFNTEAVADMRSTRELLVTIDERTKGLDRMMADFKASMVSRHEFTPVRNIVYGFTGLMLTGVLLALLALVLRGA